MTDTETLIDRIRHQMTEQGMSQSQLAERSGIAQGNLSNYLSGQRTMTVETLGKIADALGCDVELREVTGQ